MSRRAAITSRPSGHHQTPPKLLRVLVAGSSALSYYGTVRHADELAAREVRKTLSIKARGIRRTSLLGVIAVVVGVGGLSACGGPSTAQEKAVAACDAALSGAVWESTVSESVRREKMTSARSLSKEAADADAQYAKLADTIAKLDAKSSAEGYRPIPADAPETSALLRAKTEGCRNAGQRP